MKEDQLHFLFSRLIDTMDYKMVPLSPSNMIVRMPNWLGDCVMATPILTDLKMKFPKCRITALCQGTSQTLLFNNPHVDDILSFDRPKGLFEDRLLIEKLRQNTYDAGLLLTNSFSSALRFWRSSIPHRIGYKDHGRSLLLNYALDFPKNKETQHLVVTYKMLLEPFAIPVSTTAPALYISKEEKKDAEIALEELGIVSTDYVLGINPGAAYGSAKCWLPEHFKALTQRLIQEIPALKILYFGDKPGASLVNEICKNMPCQVINLAAKTSLRQLFAYIQRCHLFLTNDSGPMHVASALKTPLIALFGSTNDTTTGPYAGGVVIHKRVPCSPCYRRECPIVGFPCMTQISVEEVFKTIQTQIISYDFSTNTR